MSSRVPSLGPRGEGWVAAQLVLFALIGAAGLTALAGPAGGPTVPAIVVGGVAIGAGGLLVLRAVAGLGSSLTPFPRPAAGTALVEDGAYRRIRHPIYAGILLAGLGWAILSGSIVTLALVGLLFLLFDVKSRREEAWLDAVFPGYVAYRTRTKRFIPGLY